MYAELTKESFFRATHIFYILYNSTVQLKGCFVIHMEISIIENKFMNDFKMCLK